MRYHKTTPVFKKMVGSGHMVLDNLAHVNLMAKVSYTGNIYMKNYSS